MEILSLSSEPLFNYGASIGIYWGFVLAGGFSVLSLFRT